MLYESAARASEVLRLDISDLDFPNRRSAPPCSECCGVMSHSGMSSGGTARRDIDDRLRWVIWWMGGAGVALVNCAVQLDGWLPPAVVGVAAMTRALLYCSAYRRLCLDEYHGRRPPPDRGGP
jgi:hypothetical protein